MSTIKKLSLLLIVFGGSVFLLLAFLWNRYLSEPYQSRYMDGQNVASIAFDGSGQAWISTCEKTSDYNSDFGVTNAYAGDIGTFKDGVFTSHAGNLDPSDTCVLDLVVDSQGRPWAIIHSTSLHAPVVYEGDQWIQYVPDQLALSEEGDIYSELAIDSKGKIWLGTYDAGLAVFDGQEWTLYDTSTSDLTHNNVSDIIFDQQGKAWIATRGGGINIFDGKNWSSITSSNSTLPTDDIMSLAFDPTGRLWVGTYIRGLYVQDGENWIAYDVYNYSFSITDIVFDGRGRAWVADNSAPQPHPLIMDSNEWTTYDADFRRAYYGGNMISDENGQIWLGSKNKRGFTVISPEYNPPGRILSMIRIFLSTGGISFLALIILGVCLTIVFDSYLGTAIGMSPGLVILAVVLWWLAGIHASPASLYLIPGTGITILGTAGGILGKVLGRSRPVRWQLVGALVGLILSTIITVCASLLFFAMGRA